MAIGRDQHIGEFQRIHQETIEKEAEERKKAGPYLFPVGSVVSLKSGGSSMVVSEHIKAPSNLHGWMTSVRCVWHTVDGLLQAADFIVDVLRRGGAG